MRWVQATFCRPCLRIVYLSNLLDWFDVVCCFVRAAKQIYSQISLILSKSVQEMEHIGANMVRMYNMHGQGFVSTLHIHHILQASVYFCGFHLWKNMPVDVLAKTVFFAWIARSPRVLSVRGLCLQGRYGKRRKYGSYIYKNTESSRAIKSEWRFCWENESTSVLTWTSSLMHELTVCACINDLRMFLGGVKMMLGRNDAKSLRQTPTHSLQEPKIENKPWQ